MHRPSTTERTSDGMASPERTKNIRWLIYRNCEKINIEKIQQWTTYFSTRPNYFGTVSANLVLLSTFTWVPPIFTPSDLIQFLVHIFSNHREIYLWKEWKKENRRNDWTTMPYPQHGRPARWSPSFLSWPNHHHSVKKKNHHLFSWCWCEERWMPASDAGVTRETGSCGAGLCPHVNATPSPVRWRQ
jgi:hypothetical protein